MSFMGTMSPLILIGFTGSRYAFLLLVRSRKNDMLTRWGPS